MLCDCVQAIEQVYSSRPDSKEIPLENPDVEWNTDGNSFIEGKRKAEKRKEKKRKAGCAIIIAYDTIDSGPLPMGLQLKGLSL